MGVFVVSMHVPRLHQSEVCLYACLSVCMPLVFKHNKHVMGVNTIKVMVCNATRMNNDASAALGIRLTHFSVGCSGVQKCLSSAKGELP